VQGLQPVSPLLGQEFYNTYQVMFKIVENLEKKGWIDESDIPEYFMERCER